MRDFLGEAYTLSCNFYREVERCFESCVFYRRIESFL